LYTGILSTLPQTEEKIPKHIFFSDFSANILNFLRKKSLNLSKTSIQKLSTNLQCTNKCNKVSFTLQKSTKYFIWKERNVVKYQKKAMSKIRIINLLKNELSFLSEEKSH
jgi:hypothetical protein